MPIEGPIVDLSSLNEKWPLDEELQSEAAPQHMQLTKEAFKKQFTGLNSGGGVVDASATELNYLAGISGNVQTLIDQDDIAPRVVTATGAASPNDKLLCNPPPVGITIALPDAPPNGTEIRIQDVSGLAAVPNNQIFVESQGSDTITNLTLKMEGLTNVEFFANSQYSIFAYNSGVWYFWDISFYNISF